MTAPAEPEQRYIIEKDLLYDKVYLHGYNRKAWETIDLTVFHQPYPPKMASSKNTDTDEFRVTRWQIGQIAQYASLEAICQAILSKPVDTPAQQRIADAIKELETLASGLREKAKRVENYSYSMKASGIDEVVTLLRENQP